MKICRSELLTEKLGILAELSQLAWEIHNRGSWDEDQALDRLLDEIAKSASPEDD